LISPAVAYEASVPLRLRQISAAAQYCSVTGVHLSKKCPARKALGSHAGLRKLVVSFGAMPCTRMQSSNVAASCLVKVAHRAAAKCGAAGLSNARAQPHDVRSPRKRPLGEHALQLNVRS
jgi:hypothetical protein